MSFIIRHVLVDEFELVTFLKDILEEIEWIYIPTKKDKMCPVCKMYSADGHQHDCNLAKALGRE